MITSGRDWGTEHRRKVQGSDTEVVWMGAGELGPLRIRINRVVNSVHSMNRMVNSAHIMNDGGPGSEWKKSATGDTGGVERVVYQTRADN